MNVAAKIAERYARSLPRVQVLEQLQSDRHVYVKGLTGSLKSFLLADLFDQTGKSLIYVSQDRLFYENLKEDLETLLSEHSVGFFPGKPKHGLSTDRSLAKEARQAAIEKLIAPQPVVLVAHASALQRQLPDPESFRRDVLKLNVSAQRNFKETIQELLHLGFIRESRVEKSGDMAVRGGIIDVYPNAAELPYRIEFWGDTIESMRTFDPTNQRSTETVEHLNLFSQEVEAVASDDPELFNANLLDYIGNEALVVLDEPEFIRKWLREEHMEVDPEDGQTFKADWSTIQESLQKQRQISIVSLGEPTPVINFNSRPQKSFNGSLKRLKQDINEHFEVSEESPEPSVERFFLTESEAQAARLKGIFLEEEITANYFYLATLSLHEGFVYPAGGLAVYTDHQFYSRTKRLRLPKKSRHGLTQKQLQQLETGDYVVHVDYGLGKFLGLEKITIQGNERECLQLQYRDGDKVYVRVERMDKVSKYSPSGGVEPKLNKLGSPEWQRMKARTKKKIKDIAEDLIDIYAKRKAQKGFQFGIDNLWQRELEASFPFEDTPDQVTATSDVKSDMESLKPMDRLVCGDVGFGKTEIAIRAAFKAVTDGKQVAMLVPTTILAYQHYNTFSTRLKDFPVHVEMLSRFRTTAEQKRITEKVWAGNVDIIIGTHRLLSNDVEFKDLGLLIVDEEQRFGVTHKERLKKFRATVDVLTLTATPIPRTLQFSLMGARDMSNINTAPKNRLPIHTEILTFNKPYVREVIVRELDRGGQVFFVHNRVRSIDNSAAMLARMIPEASIAVAHGQMNERELEKIMISFMHRKYDILVATMIIESGLDMPNVNTIVVDRADKLGLAQLYQLRGRVGRSHQKAYAYLLIPPVDTLNDDALKRLRAIEEFSDIGSGAMLAMRDLEIRGAGNLLGAEQTGFIDALGFELYNKILDEAVRELKEEKLPDEERAPEIETQVEMDCDAYIPDSYVDTGSERIVIYRRLIEAPDAEVLQDIHAELVDRFGGIPGPLENLFNYITIKMYASKLGITSVQIEGSELTAEFADDAIGHSGEPFREWLGSIMQKASESFEFIQNESLGIRMDCQDITEKKLATMKSFLYSLTL